MEFTKEELREFRRLVEKGESPRQMDRIESRMDMPKFTGYVLKDGHTWGANKTDVTGAACGAVCEHVIANGGPVTVTCNGKPRFQISVIDLDAVQPQEAEGCKS